MLLSPACLLLPLVATAADLDFARQVHPLLLARCGSCHSGAFAQAGLRLTTRADMLAGGVSGPAIVAGSSERSLLIARVTGARQPRMPFNAEPLADAEVAILRRWIDAGAPVTEARPARRSTRPLALRAPKVNAGPDRVLDALVTRYLGSAIAPPVADALFARRLYLDLWGLLPTPEQLDEFERDRRPHKRTRLAGSLLADADKYASHWITFWNDHLRNDEGVVYHGERKSITQWLLGALRENLPYDRFVRALLNPEGPAAPDGFLIGVNWRGDVSASQIPPMQAAQNSAQVFLGVNLKCNACHDSFISHWKLKDAYGLASFFADKDMEMYRCDVATGEIATPSFLFPELNGSSVVATPAERRAEAARLFTMRENGRLPRTFVNRVWKTLFGRGLIEPADDLDAPAWNEDLLDWLASDFVGHAYDVKHLLLRIMSTRTYQMPAAGEPFKPGEPFRFRGPLPRRLGAEQFADAVGSITGEWRLIVPRQSGEARHAREWQLKSTALTRALGRPIRDQVTTERLAQPTTLEAIELANGQTLAEILSRGARRMRGEITPAPVAIFDSGVASAAKVIGDVPLRDARRLWLLIEDVDSYDPRRVVAGWANAMLEGQGGEMVRLRDLVPEPRPERGAIHFRGDRKPAEALLGAVPSAIEIDLGAADFTCLHFAAGVDQQSLASDINPRIRFFVFTEEPDRRRLIPPAGEPPVRAASWPKDPSSLVSRLYRHALARDPSPLERGVALEFLAAGRTEGLDDLLWALFSSPEFQYIQ